MLDARCWMLGLLQREHQAVEHSANLIHFVTEFLVLLLIDVIESEPNLEMCVEFPERAACEAEELLIFASQSSPLAFGDICRDRSCGSPNLTR